jgi:hypothetical protein
MPVFAGFIPMNKLPQREDLHIDNVTANLEGSNGNVRHFH